MKTFNFFEKLWEHSRTLRRVGLVLVMCLITITQTWAANKYFTPGETIFIITDGDGAWGSSACVKTAYSTKTSSQSNNISSEEATAWLWDGKWDDVSGKKCFYTIVPETSGLQSACLERYPTGCSGNRWNWNGNWVTNSGKKSDAHNTFYSSGTGTSNFGWKNATYSLYLYGGTNGWASAIGTLVDRGNGVFAYSFIHTATASSYEFKILDSQNQWHGNNVTLSGLSVGTKYIITATVDLKEGIGSLAMSTGGYSTHEPGVYEAAVGSGGYGQTLKTVSSRDYEVYHFASSESTANFICAGTTTTTYSDKHCLLQFGTSTEVARGWLSNYVYGCGSSYSNLSATGTEFNGMGATRAYQMNYRENVSKLTLVVSGYDQFAIWAKDNNTTTNHFVVTIDGASQSMTYSNANSGTRRAFDISTGEHIIEISATGTSSNSTLWGFSLRLPAGECSATAPGALNKGTLSGCSRTITASGSAATNNTWYWQSSASGTDKSDAYSSGKAITAAGTYYLRSFCSDGSGCWSDAVQVTITAADMTPAAPTALAKSSVTAKGVTLTVTDAANTNDYEFYVNTSSSAPSAGTSASYTSTSKSVTITDKYAGTTFYAWARAKCGSNKSAWTALTGSTFTTSTVSAAYHLANVSKTSGAESGIGGSTFTAVFSANTGYSMPTPVVTIGGNAATSGTDYTWTEGTGTLTIAKEKITGNIDITLNSVPSAPSSAVISGTYHYFPGENISLTVTPSGNNGPTTYQWYKGGKADGNRIDGATSATYTKNSCTFDDAGSYYCKVTCNATSIWAVTNSHENYDVKILRLYVNGSKGGVSYGNVDFVKVNSTTARASISLGSNWTYGFNIADGCGHYYGNYGTMQENNCTNWTTNVSGTDCGLTTTNAATYIFTINYSNLLAITTSVTFPVVNQAAGKVIYFDNNVLKWTGSSIYYRIGHSSHTQADQLSLVPGTANLYKMTTREYKGFSAWQIGNAEGGNGSGKSIYNTKNTPAITASIAYEGASVTADAVTVTPGVDHSTGGDAQNDNCEFYSKTITDGMKTDRVTISPYSNGTITVNYTNTSNVASTLTSGYADLAHTVKLTSITAVPAEGYEIDDPLTINGEAYVANYVVTDNTTIAASFKLKTYTISYNKGTYGTGSKASETKTHGVNFTLPGSTFTYGGHAQDGWSTSDGGALAYALSGSYTTNAAQEFFPHWKCNTPTITDNGDNTVSITVPSGTTVRYTTDGTNPSSSTGTVYSTTFSIAADCTVKAIAYQSNCTDSEIASQACDYTAPANFQMIANSSAGSDATLANNESISQGSKNCATLTGGTAVYSNADGDSKSMTVKKPNNSGQQYGWYFDANKDVITITMSAHIIKAGSIISVTGYAASNNGVKINGYASYLVNPGAEGNFTTTYTVLNTDTELLGKNVLTLSKKGSTKLYSITISNCQSATPCTTPTLPSLSNQAGCSYSAWNATPSNASTISAAGESISYSWKKGATEKATTASYTPDANGTDYTVTVTVSKAGKISTSVTSSALSATKYAATSISTQPTTSVDAIEGENFTLGTGMVAVGQGTKTYQWYSYTSSGGAGEASIGSATSATYTTSKASAGTYYYKVKVTADCGTATSNMITVTVSEPPCFSATNLVKNGDWSDVAVDGSIDAAKVVGTITGGTIKNTGSAALGSNSKSANAGLVMDGSSKQVTVTLSGSNHLTVGSVITLTAAVSDGAKSGTSKTSGLVVSGYDCSPVNKASETAYDSFTQSYTVTEESSLVEANSFTIALKSGLDKTYLHAITVTGCEDCTPIDPELSYSKTTIWMDDADLTATPSLNKDVSTGSVTYTLKSATPAGCVTLNPSTGVVTAVSRGTATIKATIAADATHCGKTATCDITIKEMDCEWTVIAGVTATSKNAGTPEGALIASSDGYKVNLQDWKSPEGGCGTGGKIGGDNQYIYLTLKSGEYFKDGDKVIVNIAKVPGVGDSKLHIYDGTTTLSDESTMIGTSGTPSCGENEIVLSGVPANTSSITLHRGNGPTSATLQNPYVTSMKVKRYVCPDSKEFLPTASSGNWNATANWIGSNGRGASLPTIDDRVVISKPVTVDIADAKAKDVLVNQYSGATGKITVSAGKALIIAEKMQKTTTGSNRIATAAADVIINSTRDAGVGALIIGSEAGDNAATMNFETKAKLVGGSTVNQFIGSPFSNAAPYVDYGQQLYKFCPKQNGDRGWWQSHTSLATMTPFWGYNVLCTETSFLDLNWTGKLNPSESKTITDFYYNGSSETDNMFANSWTAPIHVGAFEDGDFVNASTTLYMFNAGTPAQEAGHSDDDATNGSTEPGTYISIPIHSAPYAGIGVIPSMQAFYVLSTGSDASITLDYNKIVYTPALTSVGIVPNRAPKHNAEVVEPEVIKLHVQSETGWGANTYVMGRADFAEGYEDGWDGAYIEGESATPKLYTPSIDGNMFINCLPEIEGTVVGFRKGSSDNNYIFSFDYDGDEVWYLNDQKAQKSTQIMNGQTYAFVSEAGDNAARFVISATPINKIATGCESVGAEAAKVRKLIINDKVYIIRGGQVFDVLGKTIKK